MLYWHILIKQTIPIHCLLVVTVEVQRKSIYKQFRWPCTGPSR